MLLIYIYVVIISYIIVVTITKELFNNRDVICNTLNIQCINKLYIVL